MKRFRATQSVRCVFRAWARARAEGLRRLMGGLLLLTSAASLQAGAGAAGVPATYTVGGRVTNTASGLGLAGLRVRLVHYHQTNRVFLQTSTDAGGGFHFAGIPDSVQVALFPEDKAYYFTPIVVTRRPFAADLTADFGATLKPPTNQLVAVTGIEVVQSVQDWRNSVPLIAGKDTYVRVNVRNASAANTASSHPFTGRLRGYRAGAELADSPLAPLDPGYASTGGDGVARRRNFGGGTLNFHLPPEWCADGTTELRLEPDASTPAACVDPAEPPMGAAGDCLVRAVFRAAPVFALRLYRVDIFGRIVSVSEIEAQLARIRAQYPTRTLEVEIRDLPLRRTGRDDAETMWLVCEQLVQEQSRDRCSDLGRCRRVFFGAMPPPVRGGILGLAPSIEASVAAGFLVSLEHEVAHALGLGHTVRTLHPSPGGFCGEAIGDSLESERTVFPTPAFVDFRLVPALGPLDPAQPETIVFGLATEGPGGTPGLPRVIDPWVAFDLMSYCGAGDPGQNWVSTYSYDYIGREVASRLALARAVAPAPIEDLIMLTGRIRPAEEAADLDPLQYVSGPRPEAPLSGEYQAQVWSQNGALLHEVPFEPMRPLVESQEPDTGVLSFHVVLPAAPKPARIVLRRGTTILAERAQSSHAPVVAVMAPLAGETIFGDQLAVAWEAEDGDGDPLTFFVEYSPDGGRTFLMMATALTNTASELATAGLPGGTNAVVRVTATDGFHSVSGLSAAFRVPNHSPEVFVQSPADGVVVNPDGQLFLTARGYDVEDGSDGLVFTWSSSLDGPLGTGGAVVRAANSLSPGRHVMTVLATDREGLSRSASVSTIVASARLLHLQALAAGQEGVPGLRIGGDAGTVYALEFSSDLSGWVPLRTNTLASGVEDVSVPLEGEKRFYRARLIGP